MNRKQKRKLAEIIAGAVLLAAAYISVKVFGIDFPFDLVAFLPAYAICGYDVFADAVTGTLNGEIFGENTLMSVASLGAMAIGEYPEAVFVMLFYKVGSLFESIAVGKSRKSIKALTSMKPTEADIEIGGKETRVPIKEVKVGDIAVVRAGGSIPVDGVIVHGTGTVDTSALTGESMPVSVSEGDRVLSGSIDRDGILKIRVDTVFEDSTVSKIVKLVEDSACTKAKSERFITTFSKYYTPAVIICAVLLAVVPSLISGNFTSWLRRALIFLVVSCPCALVISVPLSYFAGIGNAAKRGILVKGSDHLETLAKATAFVFDKTGTVTEGNFRVTKIEPASVTEDELLKIASCAESGSRHPLAAAVVSEYRARSGEDPASPEDMEEIPGLGIKCRALGHEVLIGSEKLLASSGIEPPITDGSTSVFVASDGKYAGCISFADVPKENAAKAISALKDRGARTYMLSGDKHEAAKKVSDEVGIDEVASELLPDGKAEYLKKISDETPGKCVFTGDGINDAPSLALCDVGIAMGALGSDLAIECADIVLLDDDPEKVSQVFRLSKKVRRTVIQNIVFALAVKAVVLILGALGFANMWEAVIADVGVSVIAILNSMKLMRTK